MARAQTARELEGPSPRHKTIWKHHVARRERRPRTVSDSPGHSVPLLSALFSEALNWI